MASAGGGPFRRIRLPSAPTHLRSQLPTVATRWKRPPRWAHRWITQRYTWGVKVCAQKNTIIYRCLHTYCSVFVNIHTLFTEINVWNVHICMRPYILTYLRMLCGKNISGKKLSGHKMYDFEVRGQATATAARTTRVADTKCCPLKSFSYKPRALRRNSG
jgi:hypothetical protein